MKNYDGLTDDVFYNILEEIVSKMTAQQLLAIGDIYTILSEELNNEILSIWEERNS